MRDQNKLTFLSPQEKRALYGPLEGRKIDIMFSRIAAYALAVIIGIAFGLFWAGMQQ